MSDIKIVILGGGIAGLSIAAGLLHNSECSITIIERTNYDEFVVGEHLPAIALRYLDVLKIPANILLNNSTPCTSICGLWASNSVETEGIFNPYGNGFIVHRPEFEKCLSQYLMSKGVVFYKNSTATILSESKIFINKNVSYTYDYMFDCTGRLSQNFSTNRLVFDRLIGAVYFNNITSSGDSQVLIESSENGWWYHTNHKSISITTFFTDADIYTRIKANMIDECLKTKLMAGNVHCLKTKATIRNAYTSILENNPKKIWQMGDAFYSLDPLSSKGMLKALIQASDISVFYNKGFEENLLENFYNGLRVSFIQDLNNWEWFYRQGFEDHKTEFYERRTKLGLLKEDKKIDQTL